MMMCIYERIRNKWWIVLFVMRNFAFGFEVTSLHCPSPPSQCKLMKISSQGEFNETTFIVKGIWVDVSIIETENVEIGCYAPSLSPDVESFPKFDLPMYFKNIKIDACALPQKSYVQTLHGLNLFGLHNLTFEFDTCNGNTMFTEKHFVGLFDLKALTISCTIFNLDYLDTLFLKPLENLRHIELNNIIIKPFLSGNILQSVKIYEGAPREKLQPWGECEELEELMIIKWRVIKLPVRWLATCSHLSSLHLEDFTTLSNLPQEMVNSSALISLTITHCQLEVLPSDLLDNTQSLRNLDLSRNNLASLDRKMFLSVPLLETLVLTHNLLMVDSIPELAPLLQLKLLNLEKNLHDNTCQLETYKPYKIINPWPSLPSLEQLSLQTTDATVLCSEWGWSMPKLKYLNLKSNFFMKLGYQDVQLIRTNGWDVDFHHNMFEAIVFNENDYKTALEDHQPISHIATIRISKYPLNCNCRWYRFAQVVQQKSGYVSLPDLQCDLKWGKSTNPMRLEQMKPDNFICEIDSVTGCRSYWRIRDNTTQVNCTNAGLDHLPQIPLLREIHMANNHIEKLNISEIPETLEYLDLQYNQLSAVDADTVLMMFNRPTTQYYLKGNLISCLCNNSAWINALQIHKTQIKDYEEVICTHGLQIKNVNTNILCLKEHAPVIAGCLGSIAFLFAFLIILYYRYKSKIHIVLYARGWCAFCVNEEELDKDKTYDVFVSFAHEDSAVVMNELVPGLEKEPHAFSVCVHYRDWMAGEWIPTQIAHSVEESRRTVIVLSNNFLSSVWALLEFRTAHTQALKDGRVRLIIVLLDDVTNDQRMDDELRSYLTTNTYIRWGDSRFWDKLRYALPHHGRNDKWKRSRGEAVVRLLKPNDPPIVSREGVALEMLSIKSTATEEIQTREVEA